MRERVPDFDQSLLSGFCREYMSGDAGRIRRKLEEVKKKDADTIQLYVQTSLCEGAIPIEVNLSQDETGEYTFTDFSETWEALERDGVAGKEDRFRRAVGKYGLLEGPDHEIYLPSTSEALVADALRFAFCIDELCTR